MIYKRLIASTKYIHLQSELKSNVNVIPVCNRYDCRLNYRLTRIPFKEVHVFQRYLHVIKDESLSYSLIGISDHVVESRAIVSPFFRPPPGQEYEKINAIKGNLHIISWTNLEIVNFSNRWSNNNNNNLLLGSSITTYELRGSSGPSLSRST